MSHWTIFLLLAAIAYLAYQHPRTMLQYLPPWLRPAGQSAVDQKASGTQTRDGSGVSEIEQPDVEIRLEDDEAMEEQKTPKAECTRTESAVPSLSLNEPEPLSKRSTAPRSESMPSSLPMPPPPKPPPPTNKASSGLMPAPSRPSLAPPPSSASTLRVPSTGPLPNRGPPANSQQRVGGGLSVNGAVPVPNPRGKVLLSPGHSPMDWAALTKSSNLSGVSTFQRVTPLMLKNMTGRKGKPAWSSWQGKVYNITPYLDFHPGGKAELMKAAGRDGTKLFMDVHPWVNWENMLGSCLVGVMVPEGSEPGGSQLEDID